MRLVVELTQISKFERKYVALLLLWAPPTPIDNFENRLIQLAFVNCADCYESEIWALGLI